MTTLRNPNNQKFVDNIKQRMINFRGFGATDMVFKINPTNDECDAMVETIKGFGVDVERIGFDKYKATWKPIKIEPKKNEPRIFKNEDGHPTVPNSLLRDDVTIAVKDYLKHGHPVKFSSGPYTIATLKGNPTLGIYVIKLSSSTTNINSYVEIGPKNGKVNNPDGFEISIYRDIDE